MAWTATKSWGTEVLTSADMNTYVSGNTEYNYDNKPQANQWINNGTSVAQLNQRIESGTARVTYSTSKFGSTLVTFNTAYGTAPRVLVTDAQLGVYGCVKLVGTGNCVVHSSIEVGTYTGTSIVNWIAIGA